MGDAALEDWIRRVRGAGLLAAIAGRLALHDLPIVRDMGADIAGVRGAACVGGRAGRVDADRVRLLRDALVTGPGRPEARRTLLWVRDGVMQRGR
jgi:uncharacterized protein (UPF0264 family)